MQRNQTRKNYSARPLTLLWVPLLFQAQHQATGMDSEIRSQLVGGPQSQGSKQTITSNLGLHVSKMKCYELFLGVQSF